MPKAPHTDDAVQALVERLRRRGADLRSGGELLTAAERRRPGPDVAAQPVAKKTFADEPLPAEPPPGMLSTGCRPLDVRLPGGGLRPGTLVDWLSPHPGGGAGSWAWRCAREACGARLLIVVDPDRSFYPPGGGGRTDRLVVVRPADEAETHWVLHQALSSPATGAVLGWEARFREHGWLRLRAAAERGGALGVFVRTGRVPPGGTWAEHRFRVETVPTRAREYETIPTRVRGIETVPTRFGNETSLPRADRRGPISAGGSGEGAGRDVRRVRFSILRCRGTPTVESFEAEWDDAANLVRPLPALAAPATAGRAARA